MSFRSAVLGALVVAGSTFVIHPPLEAEFKIGKITTIGSSSFELEDAVISCLEYCTELVGVRQVFNCAGYYRPPIENCDLPWIDSHWPTGAPVGQEETCVPKEPEFGGFHLFEDVDRVRRTVRHTKDCTTEIIQDVELEQLDPRGNPPRPSPDPGMWTQEDFALESIAFVRCN